MIEKIFSDNLNLFKSNGLSLVEIQLSNAMNINSSFDMGNILELRNEKHRQLYSNQTLKLIDRLVHPIYADKIKLRERIQFMKIKDSNNLFFGSTIISSLDYCFVNGQKKFPQGLCEILFADGSYFIGQFENGSIKSQFIYISSNGDYIKSKKVINKVKKVFIGFVTDDSDEQQEKLTDNSTDSDDVQQSNIKFKIFQNQILFNFKLLQCQISYNGIQYKGPLKNGQLHGKIYQKGHNYTFQGNYYQGKRKIGKFKSNDDLQYEGTFKDNKFHGLGTLKTKQGSYQGQFINGLKDGQGSFKSIDGSIFTGQFVKDKQNYKNHFKSTKSRQSISTEQSEIGCLFSSKQRISGSY